MTLNRLRDAADEDPAYRYRHDDIGSIGVVPVPLIEGEDHEECRGGGFIMMTWYKNRGRTTRAYRVDETVCEPLTLAAAEEAIECLEATQSR